MTKQDTNVQTENASTTDAEASSTLRVLFARYLKLKKSKPKMQGEASILPALHRGTFDADEYFAELRQDFDVWAERIVTVVDGMQAIGQENPGASIPLVAKDGNVISVNGSRLASALLREDSRILSAKLQA